MRRDEFAEVFEIHGSEIGALEIDNYVDNLSDIKGLQSKLADTRCEAALQSKELRDMKKSLDQGMKLAELTYPGQPRPKHYGWIAEYVRFALIGTLKSGFSYVNGNPYQISTGIADGESVVFTFDPNTQMISSSHGGTRSISDWMARSDADTNTTAKAVIDAFKRFAIDKGFGK